MANGGDLIVLAEGIEKFGEDDEIDRIIRKYGYAGRMNILRMFSDENNSDLRNNMATAAHLIHGSSDGRFNIIYAVKNIGRDEIEAAGFESADYDEMIKKYDPEKMTYGYNEVEGEEVFFIPNPALGLWMERNR